MVAGMEHTDTAQRPPVFWFLITQLAFLKFVLHAATAGAWGSSWFIDELYFLACAENLDWGYVDMPPLFPAVLRAWWLVFGDSVAAIRLLPALAGAGLVVLTGLFARQLGGGRWAQAVAAVAVVVAPGSMALHDFASMNALDPLFWAGCALVLVERIRCDDGRMWLLFGAVAALGFLSKHTFGLWGLSLVAGVLLSPLRRDLGRPWIWLGGGLAVVMVLPNLAWVVDHGFPHLEQLANIRGNGRNVALGPLGFLWQQVLFMNPASAVVWLSGLGWLLGVTNARDYRPLGVAWLVFITGMILLEGRSYYPAPSYPLLLAAGGVALEGWLRGGLLHWGRVVVPAGMMVSGAVLAPLFVLLLPPATYTAYADTIGFGQPRIENHRLGPLPQLFADRYGWPELAREVARVYHELPAEDRERAAIFGQNYGQAGAIDRYRDELGLPRALSGHLTYFLWGPRGATGDVFIVLGDDRETLEGLFASVERAGRVQHPLSMPSQHVTVWVCRDLVMPVEELWPRVKNYS
jgi:4-amino-4-deoxy-L-arabinose transferase-like glycosyltransferase